MSREEAIVTIIGIIAGTIMVTGVVGSIAWAWVRGRRASAPLPDGSIARIEQRLERMEQAIDAMSVEMERVSEGQRFTTRLLSEQVAEKLKA
jgi:hypothetical protein